MRVSPPWALASIFMVAFIWGNSMVPGSGSSGLSSAALDFVCGILSSLGLPTGWLSEFLIRKAAHFTEYAILAVFVSNAVWAGGAHGPRALLAIGIFLASAACVDEAIQLYSPGRCGQLPDVLLDCAGSAFGVAVNCIQRSFRIST